MSRTKYGTNTYIFVFSLTISFQQIFSANKFRKILDETALKDVLPKYELTTELMNAHVYTALHSHSIE